MLDNIVALQKQLQGVGDDTIKRALATPNEAVPQFLLMMEMKRRQDLRTMNPQGPYKARDMRSEMATGTYQPVPKPPMTLPEQSGLASLQQNQQGQAGQAPQAPQGPVAQNLDLSKPAGIGSLFGGNR